MLRWLCTIGLSCWAVVAMAQVEARMHQVFEVKNYQKAQVKIDDSKYEVNIKETYSTVIVVEIIVMLDRASPRDMEEIIRSGRYQVQSQINEGVLALTTKENKTPVVINGLSAEEHVIYNISIPEYIEY